MIGDLVIEVVLVGEQPPGAEHGAPRDLRMTLTLDLWKTDHHLHPLAKALSEAASGYSTAEQMQAMADAWDEEMYLPPVEMKLAGIDVPLRLLSVTRRYKDHNDR